MSKTITLTIDGLEVCVPEGTLIVDAAKKVGIDIPVFCYHPKLEPVGMCRMCLVEVGRPIIDRATGGFVLEADGTPKIQYGQKLETACTTPVTEGMIVICTSEKVIAARQEVIEFILTSHPLDCPVCDKGGECPLQNLTMRHGPGQSRFLYDEKMHLAKQVPLGELIYLDRERCIQCGRCVRFQSDIADDPVIGFYQRGRSLEIVTYSDPGFDSQFSGNTTDICPVGALTTADFRFGARPWELKTTASICPHCPVGCNLAFSIRREARSGGDYVIKRVLPRQNEWVNEIWNCDKGRFAYQYTERENRINQPLIRRDGELVLASWDEALNQVEQGFREAGKELVVLAGGRLANEDLFNLRQLSTTQQGRTFLDSYMAGGDLVAQVGVGKGTNLGEFAKGTVVLVVACDLLAEAPIWWLRIKQAAERGATLIVANPRPTRLDRYASQVIHYAYGQEAATVLGLVNALSAKRPELPGRAAPSADLKRAAETFSQAENAIILYGSEGLGLSGSNSLAQACANLLIATNHTGKPNNGLIPVWSHANDQGAWDIGWRPAPDLSVELQTAKAIYCVATDPFGDNPKLIEMVAHKPFLVVQELFLTESARLADVVLPAQAFTEREGTYTSGERRLQRFYPAVSPLQSTRPDFAITAEIGQRLGITMEGKVPARIMQQIAVLLPEYNGIAYRKLAEVQEQWPVMGRDDLYYGGTTHQNTQGIGVQLIPASQRGEVIPLSWPHLATLDVQDGLCAVPVTRLYDRGRTVYSSELLRSRIGDPAIQLNPEDADLLKVAEGSPVVVILNGTEVSAIAHLDETLPKGIVTVPRSMGFPIGEPTRIEIRASVKV